LWYDPPERLIEAALDVLLSGIAGKLTGETNRYA